MENKTQTWKLLGIKDKLQYITAILLIISGIAIAFLAFFLTYDISNGVLVYIAQAFVAGGSIMGVSIYFRDKLIEAKNETFNMIEEAVDGAFKKRSTNN